MKLFEKSKELRMGKTVLIMNEGEGMTPPDFKTYCIAVLIMTGC